ncbi:hypothetical protein KIS1582_3359 [Cytobacillus firmus]|uniref:Uncharacterized protein n=1 Tax=Cytobacillus firmus TaxID=1399 RepID=A0A800MUV5_CYTFI|nr:hypothetical protein KIS1582_3359 [Cytobacillus firmus]
MLIYYTYWNFQNTISQHFFKNSSDPAKGMNKFPLNTKP